MSGETLPGAGIDLEKKAWKDGAFVNKTLAFLTSSALAWGLLIIGLGITYIALKMPSLAPQTEITKPAVPVAAEPMRPAEKSVRRSSAVATKQAPAGIKSIATEAINTPAMPSFEAKKEVEIVTQKQDQPVPIGIAPPFPPFPPN